MILHGLTYLLIERLYKEFHILYTGYIIMIPEFVFSIVEFKFLSLCLVSLVLGAFLGIDREFRGSEAGVRVHVWMSLSATVLTYLATHLSESSDPGHLVGPLILAIGLVGAGVVYHVRHLSRGLGLMSTLWVVATVGILVGAEKLAFAVTLTAVVLIFLWVTGFWSNKQAEDQLYYLTLEIESLSLIPKIEDILQKFKLNIEDKSLTKGDVIHLELKYRTSTLRQHLFLKKLFRLDGISSVNVI